MGRPIKNLKAAIKKPALEINRDNEGHAVMGTIYRTKLNFQGGKVLSAGDIVKHVRVMKVVSITHKDDGTSDVELEIIKRNWSQTQL